MPIKLFAGPGARDAALQEAELLGRYAGEYGDQGLKVDDSREIIQLSYNPGLGDRPPSILIGPMNRATPEAADALLKTIEENDSPLRMVLWAEDAAEVISTIRSRTQEVWCPQGVGFVEPLSVKWKEAREFLTALRDRNLSAALSFVERESDWGLLYMATQQVMDPLSVRDVQIYEVMKQYARRTKGGRSVFASFILDATEQDA